jgi:hypothetical protein
MKNAIVIALALVSVAAFAGTKVTKEAKKAAMEACKSEGKKGKELKSCVKEKTAAPAAEAKTEAAPAATTAPATK